MPGPQRHELFPAHLTAVGWALSCWARPGTMARGSFGTLGREYASDASCSGEGMRASAAIVRATRALFLLVMAFAVCFGVAATGPRRVPLAKGPAAWASSERGHQGNRQSGDPAPDDDNDASDADVDDGDQKVDAFIAPASMWVGHTLRSGSRLVCGQRRIWRSFAQLGVALPRAPPTLS